MRERPIIFGAADVRATLAGRKTQIRPLVKLEPHFAKAARVVPAEGAAAGVFDGLNADGSLCFHSLLCPYEPGDRLWVRETWGLVRPTDPTDWLRGPIKDRNPRTFWDLAFRADYGLGQMFREPDSDTVFWRPSIHMPRWASRITLEVTGVRVERLQAISEEDAVAEGALADLQESEAKGLTTTDDVPSARRAFKALWESINGPESWAANPWVWVVEFRRVTP